MAYLILLILVTLATFAVVSTAAGAGIAAVWCWCRNRRLHLQASRILLLRLVPALLGVIASALTTAAFVRYEPREAVESPGPLLVSAASAALCFGVIAALRVTRRLLTTARFLRTLEPTATGIAVPGVGLPAWRIESAFPLVAVVGVWRPRLLVARRVLDEIPADELQVVLEHELAHARRRDNLVQVALTCAPDLLTVLDPRLGLTRAWEAAAEEAADDLATRASEQARVSLASALVRVSRMAAGQAVSPIPLLAIHRGDAIERRVRRLLGPAEPSDAASPLWSALVATLLLSLVMASSLAGGAGLLYVHHAVEWLVNVPR
ncbi:MAG TPA: M56 family metallopeptidase [Vicinamibacterales bacterium]|nr:M56 family metallopeptidase [Vicinamibacterales bacterium]